MERNTITLDIYKIRSYLRQRRYAIDKRLWNLPDRDDKYRLFDSIECTHHEQKAGSRLDVNDPKYGEWDGQVDSQVMEYYCLAFFQSILWKSNERYNTISHSGIGEKKRNEIKDYFYFEFK